MISEELKEKTLFEHHTLEEKMNSGKIFTGDFTLEDYEQMVEFNYRFFNNFEDEVFDLIPANIAEDLNLSERRKFPSLQKDADDLGLNISDEIAHEQIMNFAQSMGVLYVMEGATLGGNVMKKNLKKIPEFADLKFHYFGIYGLSTGEKWQQFKEILNKNIHSGEDREQCLIGAKTAFNYLLGLFVNE